MRNDAFPAPPSPVNTALSSCIRGGFFWKREGCFERHRGRDFLKLIEEEV
jgi:hypothetical protein